MCVCVSFPPGVWACWWGRGPLWGPVLWDVSPSLSGSVIQTWGQAAVPRVQHRWGVWIYLQDRDHNTLSRWLIIWHTSQWTCLRLGMGQMISNMSSYVLWYISTLQLSVKTSQNKKILVDLRHKHVVFLQIFMYGKNIVIPVYWKCILLCHAVLFFCTQITMCCRWLFSNTS